MRFGPFFYDKRKAGQDKMFILTLLLYIILYFYIMQNSGRLSGN